MDRKTAIITGASRGIGAAAARLLHRDGCAVALCYEKNKEAAWQLARSLDPSGATAFAQKADVRLEADLLAAAEETLRRFGRIDLLVASAGISHIGLLQDTSPAQIEDLLAVNLRGAIYACRAVLPAMLRQKSGRMVLLSSVWGGVRRLLRNGLFRRKGRG